MKKTIQSQKDYIKFVEEILEHDSHYFSEAKPIISDFEYDTLVKEVEAYEKKHPDLVLENSPTQRVGEALTEGFKRAEHAERMLSLANTYSEEELTSFIERMEKLLKKETIEYCCELKIDGTAISVRYEKGKLVRAATRGNGKVGDDVTHNIKTIKTIPLKLHGSGYPNLLEVRGEIFMHKKTFLSSNKKREEEGLEPWANPRNAAAGSLKLLDPKEVAKRNLDVIFYGVAFAQKTFSSQFEVHKSLKKWGLPTSSEDIFIKVDSKQKILSFAHKIEQKRKSLSFEIDGIVVKVDDISSHEKLGYTGKSPRYAVAYKFSPEQAETTIKDITVQVGRTGVLTPVAELEPVHLAGSTISRATLHNQDEINRKDIRIGDHILIEKGGDVIPKVVQVIFSKRKKTSTPFVIPECCPICHTKAVHQKGEVAIRCPNKDCYGQSVRKIGFYASKVALDIANLGSKIVQTLVDEGLVGSISDLYRLTEEDLTGLEGFQKKSIKNLLQSIDASKKCSLSRFILGLQIPYVGIETADILARHSKNLDAIMALAEDELIDIEGIGEKVASSIVAFFKDAQNRKEIKALLDLGVTPQKVASVEGKTPFTDKTVVVTGTLEEYGRDEAKDLIRKNGGKVGSSVSQNTDYVVVGESPGSKYAKAKKLGIKILSEKEFKSML